MKFLIQKCNKKIQHDFSFTLLESIRYLKWLGDVDVKVKYIDFIDAENENWNWWFSPFHEHYIPIGSVEFVTAWFKRFHDHKPKPINVPEEIINFPTMQVDFCGRKVINGNHMDLEDLKGKWFVKSNDHIKGFALPIDRSYGELPAGHYQMSELIDIDSEWRAFVYQGKLVGLQNYSGDFELFPNTFTIKQMINAYKSAPVAYTLDVGVTYAHSTTRIIEVHDFFSCGLYGFADHKILPYMHSRWHYEYLKNLKNGK